LGRSTGDPYINLTGVAVNAVISLYTPSTVTSSVIFPAGIETVAQQNIYYDSTNNKSYITLLLKNTSKNTISISTRDIVVVDSKTNSTKILATVEKYYALASITPTATDNQDEFFQVRLTADGDLTEDKTLSIQGKAATVTASKLDLSKVKIPSGFSFLPIDLNNFWFDIEKNKTTVYLGIKNAKVDTKASALSFVNIKAATAKMNTVNPYAAPGINTDKNRNEYFYEIGTFKGDVRIGKKLSLTGNIAAVARTKYTNTATLATNTEGIFPYPNLSDPEYWKYNSKTKTTSVTQYFSTNKDSIVATIYSCNLKISLNGKAIKAITTGGNYNSASSNGEVVIATLPGDLRTKGGNLVITGNYALQPCN
jgi:hypothetical protein